MILLRSFLSGHIRIKRTLEYYDAGIGPRVPFGGGFGPTVSANFAVALGDFTTLSSTSTMPPGGSISRAGNAMLYAVDGGVAKLTYAPNNLLLYSQDITNAAWNASTVGVTRNDAAGTAPDGTNTACLLQETTAATSWHFILQTSLTPAAGVKYLYSVYVKYAGTRYAYIQYGAFGGMTTDGGIDFNTNTAVGSATVTPVGSGWYRVTVPTTTASATAGGVYIGVSTTWPVTQYTGSTSNGVLVWGAQLEAVTYQTTPSTYVITTTSAYYGPRFDYDPVTLQPKGLLVEGTRTNYRSYSSDFTQTSAWTKLGSCTVNNTTLLTIAPDGTNTAQAIVPVSNNSVNGIVDASGTIYLSGRTVSFYAKAGTGISTIAGQDGAGNVWTVNLSNGSSTFPSVYTYNSVTSVGNGWYRVAFNSTNASFYIGANSGANGSNYFSLWGVQVENGAFVTSFIPTVATGSIARAAETFSLTGYANRLVEAYYIDEETGANFSGNSTVVASGDTTINPPTFGWVTSLRAYTNAYAGSISTPSWLSFSRAGNAMYFDSTGTLAWAPANLLTYSQDYRDTAAAGSTRPWIWDTVGGATPIVTINAGTAPDGTLTANRVILNKGAGTYSRIRQDAAAINGPVYLFSVYMKTYSGGTSNVGLRLDGTGINCVVTGTWQRFSLYVASSSASASAQILLFSSIPGNDNTADLLVWGAQLEPVTYQTAPSAYIPTTSAAVYGPRYDYDPRTYFGFTATITNATPNSTFVVPTTFGDGSAASGVENYYVGQTALINGVSYPVTAYAASSRTVTITGLPAPVSQSILLGNPEWQKPRGLLIEEQRQNLATYSEQLNDTAWTKYQGSINSNLAVAPNGTTTADRFYENTALDSHVVSIPVTNNNAINTFSIYAKAGERNIIQVQGFGASPNDFTINPRAYINLSTGTITSSAQCTASIINVGNGWYRCVITQSAAIPNTSALMQFGVSLVSSGTTTYYTGDGVSGVYLWGAQLEAASFATSYIPSITGATRAPDVAQLTGSALTTLQGANWTFVGEIGNSPSGSVPVGIIGQNAFGKNAVRINGSVVDLLLWVDDGTTQAFVSPFNMTLRNSRIGVSGTSSATSMVANAGTVQNIAKGMSWAGGAYLGLGPSGGGNPLNSTYRSVAIYNQRLPNTILAQKSTVGSPY